MADTFGTMFRRNKPGDPVRNICNTGNLNKLFNIAETIQGCGCRVVRDSTDGIGWMIVVDGGSDIPFPSGVTPPWSGSAALPDYPWKVTVANTGTAASPVWTLSMTDGIARDLSTGTFYSGISFASQTIAKGGYLYYTFPADVRTNMGGAYVAYGQSLTPATDWQTVPVAEVVSLGAAPVVRQFQYGTAAIIRSIPEEV